MKLLNWARIPTALQVAVRDLESAKLLVLTHEASAEYHAHMVHMLHERIARLRRAVSSLAADESDDQVARP